MRDNLFKIFNAVAIFVLGLSSPVVIHLVQLAITAKRYGRGAAMIGWDSSLPWNLYGIVGFVVALAVIVLYAFYRSRKDIEEQEKRDERLANLVSQAVTDGVEKAITKLKEEGKL